MTTLVLGHGLAFEDLYRRQGLMRLDAAFVGHLREVDVALHNRLMVARHDPTALARKDEADLLVALAPHLEDFIGELFGIGAELRALQAQHDALAPLYSVKRLFVQRRAVKGVTPEGAAALDGPALAAALEACFGEALAEESYARHVARWMEAEADHGDALELAARYAAWATLAPAGREKH
ncbi:MAG TPA: pyridine nucleotide-disulfide oxidoreductase, partial [Stellaceae bacterium]|nr:pyridine nucleotide-disulfide oxidoreductase [Stellaceae bacterium]